MARYMEHPYIEHPGDHPDAEAWASASNIETIIRNACTESCKSALEAAAKIAEGGIEEMESQHASWRESLGTDCAQPYDDEIRIRREIAAAIRSLKD